MPTPKPRLLPVLLLLLPLQRGFSRKKCQKRHQSSVLCHEVSAAQHFLSCQLYDGHDLFSVTIVPQEITVLAELSSQNPAPQDDGRANKKIGISGLTLAAL